MNERTRHGRKLATAAAATVLLAGAAISTAGALQPTIEDPFDHTPEEVQCNDSSVYVILHVDTTKITTPAPVAEVVYLESDIGTFGSSPSPMSFPVGSGSVYWTIPFADLGSAHITWSVREQAGGTFIDSGTIFFDFTGLCPTSTSTSTTTTSTTVLGPAVEPAAATAPEPVVAAAVAASPRVTG